MLIVGLASTPDAITSESAASVDVVLLSAAASGEPATSGPEGAAIWGASLSSCTREQLDALKEAGCDLIVVESDSTPGLVLRDDGMAKGYVLPRELSDHRIRAVDDLAVDVLLVRPRNESWPISVGGALDIQETVSAFSKHVFLQLDNLPPPSELELLRDMPISAIVVDLKKVEPGELAELKKAISTLEPRKQRHEHSALLPTGGGNSRPQPDHEDDDDDDDDWDGL